MKGLNGDRDEEEPLTPEQRIEKRKEEIMRGIFVQDLLFSTLKPE